MAREKTTAATLLLAALALTTPGRLVALEGAVTVIGEVSRDCAECADIVAVPGIGHTLAAPGKPLYATRTEITWHQYLAAVREGYCPQPDLDDSRPGAQPMDYSVLDDDNPLTYVAPTTFQCYLRYLKNKTGRAYRIPNAVEWEHIAKGGAPTRWPWGDELGQNQAILPDLYSREALLERFPKNIRDKRVDVATRNIFPVAQLSPNGFGLFDVLGNVAEITTQRLAPNKRCLERYPAAKCQAVAARGGNGINLPEAISPAPDTTWPWNTVFSPLNGPGSGVGYRLVRD